MLQRKMKQGEEDPQCFQEESGLLYGVNKGRQFNKLKMGKDLKVKRKKDRFLDYVCFRKGIIF